MISLSIRNRNHEAAFSRFVETHQASTLLRCKAPRSVHVVELAMKLQFVRESTIDQNLGTILVISGGERTRHPIGPGQAETETIALLLVLLCVFVEVFPQLGREGVFAVDFLVQKIAKRWPMCWLVFDDVFESEALMDVQIAPETYEHDSLAVLRQKFHGVDHLGICAVGCVYIGYFVAQLIQRLADDSERVALVVTLQVLHVFQQKCSGTLGRYDSGNIEEERTLGFALEPVLATQRVLFRYPGEPEWLTGETCKQHVMIRNFTINVQVCLVLADFGLVGQSHGSDVQIEAMASGIAVVVGLVGSYRVLVPFGSEQAFADDRLEALADSADTGEQIDKGEGALTFDLARQQRT